MSDFAIGIVDREYRSGGAVDADKRNLDFQGIPIAVETPKGALHSGPHHEGPPHKMAEDYGYIRGTLSHDGDEIDCFIGPSKKSTKVFVIDQHDKDGKFDESKCFLGFNRKKEALAAYRKSYGPVYGEHHTIGAFIKTNINAFKDWLASGGGQEPASADIASEPVGKYGEFKIPHDVIKKMGNGDPEIGLALSDKLFGHHLDHGRGVVHQNIVRWIGDDDLTTGHKVLQRFVEKIRGTEGETYHGRVKATKAEAHYRKGTEARRCEICSMFRAPDACTAVKGKISPEALCDYFEPTQ